MDQQNNKEALVVHYFLTEENNSVSAIATKLEITEHRVHVVINKYLKNKTIGNA
jgi:hypothetical protein